MTFPEAVDVLGRALRFGINPTLEGTVELLDALGRPHDAFASVQITGTNGKTSTARITAALLAAEGKRVGLFTSPHLQRYSERIEIDGAPVGEAEFARGIEAAVGAAEALRGEGSVGTAEGFTEFELLTGAALWLFREQSVEVAVLEVGLGGRWDATSVVSPSVAVITGIGLDHTGILGESVEEIAADKATIIKPGCVPVLGPGTAGLDAVFLARTDGLGLRPRAVRADVDFSPVAEELTVRYRVEGRPNHLGDQTLIDVDGIYSRYNALAVAAPSYQAANVATAVATTEAVLAGPLRPERMRSALASLTLPARFEVVRRDPLVIVDGSHNPQAAGVLASAIREVFPDPGSRPGILLGILADKDAAGIVRELLQVADVVGVAQPDSPRALSAASLASLVAAVTGSEPRQFGSVSDALSALVPSTSDGLVVTGSLTTAGEAREWLLDGSETLSA